MSHTVVGVFNSNEEAQRARQDLLQHGFDDADVTVKAHSADTDTSGSTTNTSTSDNRDEGFMASVGSFFSNIFGGDESDSTGHYSEAVRRGRAVVTVTVQDETAATRAQSALASCGAVNIDALADSWRQEGYSGFDASAQPFTSEQVQAERTKVIPVVREELEVGKREVDLGAVRVFARTVEKPVTETVDLREQHASIERRPVDRVATAADLNAFQEGSIEIRETAERAVVNKSARVVEEVTVGTASTIKQETVSDTVRNTVVDVQRDGDHKADSAGYQSHFESNYGSQGERFEDYQPAYSYGSTLHSDQRYASASSWNDVEANAQRDWTSKNPDTPWERVKGAVQHGWESMTGSSRTAA
jgi:uncharacterized protein (TIGR02271 family)